MAPLHNIPAAPTFESKPTSSLIAPRFFRIVVAALGFVFASFVLALVGSSIAASPASALIEGVDVSNWQGNINWPAVPSSQFRFAIIKASEGTTYTDPYFQRNWEGAGSRGMYRGAYHFARPAGSTLAEIDADARAEAYWFVSRIASVGGMGGPMDLPAVLDLEYPGDWKSGVSPPAYKCWYMSQAQLAQWMRTWLSTVHTLTGKVPILYTNSDYWNSCDGAPADIASTYRLWLASWGVSNPSIPRPWSSWTFWQDGGAPVPGIGSAIDHNYFCCDERSLQALAGGSGGSPFGILHSISVPEPTYANVFGWAIDPDSRDPIPVDVYVYGPDGKPGLGRRLDASGEFPGLAAAYPGFGGAHAYFTAIPVPLGAKQVCAFGINVGSGGNSLLGCKSLGGDPFGVIDSARAVGPGRIEVSGWAIDPTGATSTQVVARINGVDTVVTANQDRPDLGNPGGLGNLHGYTAIVQVSTGGNVQVCMGAVNSIGPGSSASLGCRTVALPGGSPLGVVDTAVGGIGSLSVTGWVVDPDTAAAIDVHVYVDGVGRLAIRADGTRNDVAAGFPGYGATRGYSGSVAVRGGVRNVCVYGINVGLGTNVLLGCRNVQVNGGVPFGALDTATFSNGAIQVTGWAVDPDTAASIPVHVYLGGQGFALLADGNRPDIAGGLPAYGPAHGFSGSLPAPDGSHSICAYAIDTVGGDGNRLLGCKTVNVPLGNPIGSIDGASVSNGMVSANGWAIDPNTAAPDIVHVYVNGVGFEIIANGSRPDLGNPWGLGSNHGWTFSAPRVGSGNQRVCVYALNIVGSGSHQLLGCRDLS
jgi:GH25 family lysozyme M1 (1,4-beta-N-acetylmuramidase)